MAVFNGRSSWRLRLYKYDSDVDNTHHLSQPTMTSITQRIKSTLGMNEPRTDTREQRRKLASDTIARSASITSSTQGASLESIFHDKQLPHLDEIKNDSTNAVKWQNFPKMNLKILNLDAFTAARELLKEDPGAEGKIAVLNLASDIERAGGWVMTLSKTQVRSFIHPN